MLKKKIIIGNWKMNPLTQKEAEKLFIGIAKNTTLFKKTEIVICSPFLYIEKLRKISKKISIGAQDSAFIDKGAFTGEISPVMLENMNVKYVILGHSERRAKGEDNSEINKKLKAAISAGLIPILCVGESTRDAEHGYFNLVKNQIEECLKGISKNLIAKIIIAYEPVWAISTTVNRHDATPADSLEMSLFIKKVLADISLPKIAKDMRIIYGGSVNERDAYDFIKYGGVDGLLSGRASLDIKKFTEIIRLTESL